MNNKEQSGRSESMKAALLSALVIPGAGQCYNRQWGKGVLMAIVFLIASLAFLLPISLYVIQYYLAMGQGDVEAARAALSTLGSLLWQLVALFIALTVLYVYSIADAYRVRQRQSLLSAEMEAPEEK